MFWVSMRVANGSVWREKNGEGLTLETEIEAEAGVVWEQPWEQP
jgi:hypothetical protein